MQIRVQNVGGDSVQRRHLLPVVVGRNPKTGKGFNTGKVQGHPKAQGTRDRLQFISDRERGLFKTGLGEHIPNPLLGETVTAIKGRYHLPNSWSDELLDPILKNDTISLQAYYEILDGVDYDFYTSRMRPDMLQSNTVLAGNKKDATFIEKFFVDLHPGSNNFSSETTKGRLAIQLLKNHPVVAPSLELMNGSQHMWVIVHEAEEEMQKVKEYRLENKVIAILNSFEEKQTEFMLYQLAVVLGLVSGVTSHGVVEAALNRHVREGGSDKQTRLAKFEAAATWFTKEPARFVIQYYVEQAINQNLVYTSGGYYFWGQYKERPERYRWASKEVLINFLLDEHAKYDPKAKDASNDNAFFVLMNELVTRGVKIKA